MLFEDEVGRRGYRLPIQHHTCVAPYVVSNGKQASDKCYCEGEECCPLDRIIKPGRRAWLSASHAISRKKEVMLARSATPPIYPYGDMISFLTRDLLLPFVLNMRGF